MKIQLGSENDETFRASVDAVLAKRGARRLWRWRGHAGSQEVNVEWYFLAGRILRLQTETFVGLSLSGRDTLIEAIAADIRSATRPAP